MSIVNFPAQEQADELILQSVFKRQDEIDSLTNAIAEMVYIARCKWIGGGGLPWGLLTDGQRKGYRDEVARLIRERNV